MHPTSSADSRWVVYTSFPTWSPAIGGRPRLSKVVTDGGEPIEVTNEAVSMAQVSPHGKLIAGTWYGDSAVEWITL